MDTLVAGQPRRLPPAQAHAQAPAQKPDSSASDGARISSAEDLLERVGAGDMSAFSDFYDLVELRVLGMVRSVLVDPALSEEVAQEVHLEIWQTAPRYDRTRGLAASWVLTIARRRAIDCVRATQSSRDRDIRIGLRDAQAGYDVVWEAVETRIGHTRALAAVQGLTPLQRECVLLAYSEGYSSGEIAVILGVPAGTVKTRIRDGLLRLRRELAADTPV
jgi:RNA polymerase sigma-70 factor (ECF subfamily)